MVTRRRQKGTDWKAVGHALFWVAVMAALVYTAMLLGGFPEGEPRLI